MHRLIRLAMAKSAEILFRYNKKKKKKAIFDYNFSRKAKKLLSTFPNIFTIECVHACVCIEYQQF